MILLSIGIEMIADGNPIHQILVTAAVFVGHIRSIQDSHRLFTKKMKDKHTGYNIETDNKNDTKKIRQPRGGRWLFRVLISAHS